MKLVLSLLLGLSFMASSVSAQEAPDVMVKKVTEEVLLIVKQDKDIQSGKDQFPKDSLWEYSRPNIDKLKSDVLNIVRSTVIKGIAEAKQLNLDCEYTGGWINDLPVPGLKPRHEPNLRHEVQRRSSVPVLREGDCE